MTERGALEVGGCMWLLGMGQLRAILCKARPLFCAAPEVALLSVVASHQTSGSPGYWGLWALVAGVVALGV